MEPVFRLPFIVLGTLCLTIAPVLTGKGKHHLKHDTADAKAVFDNFASAIAIFDVDKDGDLDCLSTVRLDYDKNASTAIYFWTLKNLNGHAQNISFQVAPGPALNQFLVKDKNSDEPVQIGTYDYTDYKNCVVMEMPYHGGDECVLWVSEKAIDDIPQHCLDHYDDNCEDAKLAYDKDSCSTMES
uniref:Lipocalin 31 n=1 Tax=Rhipicephalus microplus TaxID=6941 RepID=A0A034WXN0_RHIMP